MSSCIMKASKIILASAILFSVSSDNSGALCEALLLSSHKRKNKRKNYGLFSCCQRKTGATKNVDRRSRALPTKVTDSTDSAAGHATPPAVDGVPEAVTKAEVPAPTGELPYAHRKLALAKVLVNHPFLNNFDVNRLLVEKVQHEIVMEKYARASYQLFREVAAYVEQITNDRGKFARNMQEYAMVENMLEWLLSDERFLGTAVLVENRSDNLLRRLTACRESDDPDSNNLIEYVHRSGLHAIFEEVIAKKKKRIIEAGLIADSHGAASGASDEEDE